MGKRYVFWKTPSGKPHRENDGKHAPHHLLAEIGKHSSINSENQITWPMGIERLEAAVKSAAIVFGPDKEELNDTDSWTIVQNGLRAAIRKCGGKKALLQAEVIKYADHQAGEHFRSAKSDYFLITSLSVASLPWKRLKVRGCEITPLLRRGNRYPLPDQIKYEGQAFDTHLTSTKYKLVRVKTSGRTINEASEQAFNAINFLRGVWNFFATYRGWSMTFSTRQDPLGEIHSGPIHTLHTLDGKLVGDMFWYEAGFTGDQKIFEPRDGWTYLEKSRRDAMAKIRLLPYRSEMENILIRYAIALDHTNLNVAFLQLWSLLEKATDTIGANYDETVRRTAWGWKDRRLAMEMLNSLRLRRNQYVHSAVVGKSHDQATFLMKHMLEPHLLRLIRNEFKVKTIDEYGRHLALPSNIATLKKRRNRLNHAVRTLDKWHKSK